MTHDRVSLVHAILNRVALPLASGAVGGLLALALHAPATPSASAPASYAELARQLDAIHTVVKDIRAGLPRAAAGSPDSPPAETAPIADAPVAHEAQQFAEQMLAKAKQTREEIEVARAAREARETDRRKALAEVELVKLRNVQNTTTPEQTQANVARRLKRLGLPEAELAQASAVGAPYIRQRSEAMLKLMEEAAAGTKLSRADIEQRLQPLDEHLAGALPQSLDDLTRRAIATELGAMVRVPFFMGL